MSIDLLTVAYIAIGAARTLGAAGNDQALSDLHMGELEFISECIEGAAEIDAMGEAYGDRLEGVWCYDVAEEYGERIARALLAKRTPDRVALRISVLNDAAVAMQPRMITPYQSAIIQALPYSATADDFGMLDASDAELLDWVNDVEARLGLDVRAFRRAVLAYIGSRYE